MKEKIMKKIFTVVVGLMMLLMFSGVSLSAEPAAPVKAAPEKQKPAKVAKVEKGKHHLKKSELTKGYYVSVQGGLALLSDGDVLGVKKGGKAGFEEESAFGVAVGKRLNAFNKQVRVEGEIGYQENDVDKLDGGKKSGDIKAYTFLVNGYYDFVKGKKIVPYITAGVGVAKVDARVTNFAHVDDIGLAYQVGVGATYHINDNWHIDLKYRYLAVTELNGIEMDKLNPEFATNNIFLGLRYRF
jgi:opacity protein-like surface antigen